MIMTPKLSKRTMRTVLLSIVGAVCVGLVIVVCFLFVPKGDTLRQDIVSPPADKNPQLTNAHVAVAGDFSNNVNTAGVLSVMSATNPDFILALGDLSYGDTPSEADWCSFVKERVAANIPFELVIGNHDDGTPGNTDFARYASCLPNRVKDMVGEYGTQNYFDYGDVVRFINISPNIRQYGHEYIKGNSDYAWLVAAIDDARTNKLPWVVVSMHKNCITIGVKDCEIGQDLQNLLVEKKIDLVLQGHEHAYMRTKQLALSDTCPHIIVDGFNKNCVVNQGNTFAKDMGTIIATVGTGGKDIRNINLDDNEVGYFDAWNGVNLGNSYGFLDLKINANVLTATFVKTSGAGDFADTFIIEQ
jgi:hypothetical protein